jgi:hypothetical protein
MQTFDIINKIAPNIISALKTIAQKLEGQNIKWVVGASCGLALQGMDVQPDDIDIITDEDGIFKISQCLVDYEVEAPKNAPSEIFDSLLSRYLINDCVVEVMGNFKIKSIIDKKWHSMNKLIEHPDIIEIEDFKIPVIPLLRSIEIYKIMGREKDVEKLLKFEQHIKIGKNR